MLFCSNCGNPANPNAKFCECCGAKITVPHAANPEDTSSCFLPEGAAVSAPKAPSAPSGFFAAAQANEPSPFAQAAASSGPSPFAQAAAAHAKEPSPYAAAAAMSAMAASSFTGAALNPEPAGNPSDSANGPIWLTAKPEEPKQPAKPFFATGSDAAYHAPEESIPMPAAPVPNVPIWLSRQEDLPEDLGDLTLDDIDPQATSPIDEVSWRAKRGGPIPPKRGLT